MSQKSSPVHPKVHGIDDKMILFAKPFDAKELQYCSTTSYVRARQLAPSRKPTASVEISGSEKFHGHSLKTSKQDNYCSHETSPANGDLGETRHALVPEGMGSQIQCKNHFPGYFSMRDLNEDSNSSSWPLFYGGKSLMGGQFYNGYMPRSTTDACAEYDKDTLKQKILEHEAIFRNQVYELHRLYRIQRDMMEDIRKKELHKRQTSIEPSSSSSLRGSQIPHGDTKKWQFPRFPLANSGHSVHSMSGVDIVSSPMSCKKGGNVHASGSTSKDCEVLECRLSKVRKKLFDLQLPADEYLDTVEGEPFHGSNMSNVISSLANGDKARKHENFFLNGCSNGGRVDWQRDVSTSGSCRRSSTRLADLNEPFLAEDGIIPSPVDYLLATNHGELVGLSNSVNPNAQFLGMQKENVQNVHRRNWDGTRDGASVSHKGKGRDWLCDINESGPKNNNMISTPQSLKQQDQLPLPSKPLEVMLNKGHHQSSNIHPTDHTVADYWREKTARTLEAPDRIHDHLDSVMTSQAARPSPYMNPSELANSSSHSAFSWGKPTGSLTENNPGLFHVYPSMNNSSSTNLGKTSQSSPLSHSILGEKWQSNGRSSMPPASVDQPIANGFYHGSFSGSKEMLAHHPSIPFSHLGRNWGEDNNHKPEAVLKGDANYMNVKPFKDMDLNEEIFTRDMEIINEKRNPEACLESLPWLRAMPSCSRMESANVCRDVDSEGGFNLYNSSSPSKDFSQMFNPAKGTTTSSEFEYHTKETADENSVRKILGVPCLDKISVSEKVTSSSVPTEGKRRVIDINLACEEVEEEIETEVTRRRIHFDLNSCIDEDVDEVPIESCFARQTSNKKIVVDINDDLLPEDPNHEESLPDDLAQLAAKAIMSLSSFSHPAEAEAEASEDPLEDSLVWFSDAICTFSNANKQTTGEEKKSLALGSNYCSIGMDEFETMTLQLEETKEEEYMPQPFVHEVEEMEELCGGAKSVANRGRRGQTRRGGRQRRDFQRDILPGLASLSRQEVTEDLQTFSGLMKATGQTWSSGSTRRNGARNGNGGGGRGRRRRGVVVEKASSTVVVSCTTTTPPVVHQLTSIEASLEGWGKTTRRPRRQRCPPGNLPSAAVPLT